MAEQGEERADRGRNGQTGTGKTLQGTLVYRRLMDWDKICDSLWDILKSSSIRSKDSSHKGEHR